MGPIELLDKLIREHGSASILKEHLALFRTQIANLESKIGNLERENMELKHSLDDCQKKLGVVESQLQPSGQCCDHCGSPSVKRIGSVPNSGFERLGVKDAIYECSDCGKKSYVTMKPFSS